MSAQGRFLPSAMAEVISGDVARDAWSVGKRDAAPRLAVGRDAALAVETRAIRQAEDNLLVETGALAKLQQIVRANAPDHCARAGRAPGDGHESKKGDKMSSHYLT